MNLPESAILYMNDSRGIYIPQHFFEETKPECIVWHCSDEHKQWILESCSNPENDHYWDAWNDAECNGMMTVTDPDSGIGYNLYQEGDLWLIPLDAEWVNEE